MFSLPLTRYGRPVPTVFHLLGDNEVDATAALGFALATAPSFAKAVLQVAGLKGTPGEIRLEHRQELGRTDIQILAGSNLLIIEAKLGYGEPSIDQLTRYASILAGQRDGERITDTAIISLTGWPNDVAAQRIPRELLGSRVIPVAWRTLLDIAKASRAYEKRSGKAVLDDVCIFLQRVVSMTDVDSNLVYIVSVGQGPMPNAPANGGYTWKSVVTDHNVYWHPTAGVGGWPHSPPTYFGFRWGGRLQEIRYVEEHFLFRDPRKVFADFDEADWSPHVLNKLGPPLKPQGDARSTGLFRNARCWVALDLLLLCDSITEARDATKARRTATGQAPSESGPQVGVIEASSPQ